MKKSSRADRTLRIVNPNAAGIDVGLTLPRKSGHIDSTPLRVIGVIDGVTQTTGIHGRFQG